MSRVILQGAALMAAILLLPHASLAHGIAGARFFPATIATDDPFAADELALPTVSLGNHAEEFDFEYSKTVFPHVSVSIAGGHVDAHPPGGPNASGFGNIEVTPTWQFATDEAGEFVASAALSIEIGGSGSTSVSDSFTTYTPKILFGKGFGGLPDSMGLLRPLALTGVVGYAIPGSSTQSKAVEWGGALEYSLLYLQNNVRDQGFGNFVAHLTPVVEFSMDSPTDAGGGGTTGTINPGLIWSGQWTQVAAEAIIPVNHESGDSVGAMMQLHFYIDDIFPHSLGTPLFGGTP